MIEELIRQRRSIYPKQYNDKPVERDVIVRLLQAAVHAPTHKRTEPWRFKVLRGDSLRRLGEFLQAKYLETEESPK